MAKKKRKSTSGRRRRVGAIKGGDILKSIAIGAGAAAVAGLIVKKLPTTVTANPMIVNAGKIVLGFVLGSRSNPMLKAAGVGVGIDGGLGLLRSSGIIAGIGNSDSVTFRAMPPARQPSLINGRVGRNAQASPQVSVINGLGRNAQDSPQVSVLNGLNGLGRTSVFGTYASAF